MPIRKTRRRPKNKKRKTRAKKTLRGGGFFDNLLNKNKNNYKEDIAPQGYTRSSSIINASQEETQNAVSNKANAASVLAQAGYATVAGLAATGVGIPASAALLGGMLISNKLANMFIEKEKLRPIMLDSMIILSNCYNLHALIKKTYEIIKNKMKSRRVNEKDKEHALMVEHIGIDDQILDHISKKVSEVTAFLLSVAEDKHINMLLEDAEMQNSGFLGPVQTEFDTRKSSNFVMKQFNKMYRGTSRFIYVKETRSDIVDNLTLINAFFIIIKSQLDFALPFYKEELEQEWSAILKETHSTPEYKKFLLPANIDQEIANLVKEHPDELKQAGDAASFEVVSNKEEEVREAEKN
jgi:hypothetical protein